MRGDSMATLSYPRDPVTGDWPDWADDRIELGPCPSDEDARWWACHAPGNADGYDVEGLDEFASLESAALDAIEAGMLPPDLGPNPLRGIADELATVYADEAERVSGTRPTDEAARRAMDITWLKLATDR